MWGSKYTLKLVYRSLDVNGFVMKKFYTVLDLFIFCMQLIVFFVQFLIFTLTVFKHKPNIIFNGFTVLRLKNCKCFGIHTAEQCSRVLHHATLQYNIVLHAPGAVRMCSRAGIDRGQAYLNPYAKKKALTTSIHNRQYCQQRSHVWTCQKQLLSNCSNYST